MNNLVLVVLSSLPIPTAGVRSGTEQSLISRGRQIKSLDLPASSVMKNMTLPPSNSIPGTRAANEIRMQGDAKAMMGKMELPNGQVESQFNANGFPSRSSIILELRIPTSLQTIQASRHGPLSAFLDKVQNELCKVGKLSNDRLQLLGIRGEYTRVPVNESGTSVLQKSDTETKFPPQILTDQKVFPTTIMTDHESMPLGYGSLSSQYHHNQFETMADQHVIVELEILPGGHTLDATPGSIFKLWKTQIMNPGGSLLRGPLGQVLKGASIERPPVSMSTKPVFVNAFKKSDKSLAVPPYTPHLALACFIWSTF